MQKAIRRELRYSLDVSPDVVPREVEEAHQAVNRMARDQLALDGARTAAADQKRRIQHSGRIDRANDWIDIGKRLRLPVALIATLLVGSAVAATSSGSRSVVGCFPPDRVAGLRTPAKVCLVASRIDPGAPR